MSATTDLPTHETKPDEQGRWWEFFLLVSSLVAALLFGTAAFHEIAKAPWRGYQREYRSALIANATNERTRRAAESFEIRYYQSYLPGLSRVDRCTTCHVGVENPAMKDAEEPLRTHPGDIIKHHPVGRFGCTICHGGQGRATQAEEAHGADPHRPAPMLRGEMLEVACAQCHSDSELPGMPVYNLSQKLFTGKACLACHSLRGVGPTLRGMTAMHGPDLSEEAGMHGLQWQIDHLLDPQKITPSSKMPNFEFTEEEARALAYLMLSFDGESPSHGFVPLPATGSRTATRAPLTLDQLGENIDRRAAPGYVGSETCLFCHTALNPGLGHTWQDSKMAHAYDAVSDVADNQICLPCHTTGLDPDTNVFVESNVGCEACHGPGKDYVAEVLAGNPEEHKALAKAAILEIDRCVNCHTTPHFSTEKHVETIRAALDSPAETETGATRGAFGAQVCLMMSLIGESPSVGLISLLIADTDTETDAELLKKLQELAELVGAEINPKAAPGYVGSKLCVFCHSGLNPEVVEHWQNSKKAHTFEAVSDAPDREVCLPCHTTGYNPETNVFAEPGVACEACHGPGRDYCIEAIEERRAEHSEQADPRNQEKNRCVECHRVHVPRERHEEAVRDNADRLSSRGRSRPLEARYAGALDRSTSTASKLAHGKAVFPPEEDLGTHPNVLRLAKGGLR